MNNYDNVSISEKKGIISNGNKIVLSKLGKQINMILHDQERFIFNLYKNKTLLK